MSVLTLAPRRWDSWDFFVLDGEFVIRYKEKPYTLRAKSAFNRTYVVLDGSTEIGSIVPENWSTRKSKVTLPDDWTFLLKSFAMWLTIIHWKRDAG
jgi:hypothetical protein